MSEITAARSDRDFEHVEILFREYGEVIRDGPCDHDLGAQLEDLSGAYGADGSLLLLARAGGQPAGAVGLLRLDESACEMGRLYVRPEHRKSGLGRRLAERLVAEARALGYTTLRLQSLTSMAPARALYRDLGFAITKTGDEADPNAIWRMELTLN